MKREFLEELGLDKPIIDSIMSEHGRSVSALKEKCKSIDEKDGIIASLTVERDGLIASLSAEGEKHAAFKNGVIDGMVRDVRPTSILAERELRRALSECDGESIKAELEKIMDSDPDAFKRDKVDAPVFSGFNTADASMSSFSYRSVR
jgi:hypothetical protein